MSTTKATSSSHPPCPTVNREYKRNKTTVKNICFSFYDSTSVRVLGKTPAAMMTARWVWETSHTDKYHQISYNLKTSFNNTSMLLLEFNKCLLFRRACATLISAPLWQCLDSNQDQVTHRKACCFTAIVLTLWLCSSFSLQQLSQNFDL